MKKRVTASGPTCSLHAVPLHPLHKSIWNRLLSHPSGFGGFPLPSNFFLRVLYRLLNLCGGRASEDYVIVIGVVSGFSTAPAAAVSSVLRCGPQLLQCCCCSSRHSVFSELPRHHYPNHCVFTSPEHTHASLCAFSAGSLFATVVAPPQSK